MAENCIKNIKTHAQDKYVSVMHVHVDVNVTIYIVHFLHRRSVTCTLKESNAQNKHIFMWIILMGCNKLCLFTGVVCHIFNKHCLFTGVWQSCLKSWRPMARLLPVTGGRIYSKLYSVSLTTWSYLSSRMRWVGGDGAPSSVSVIIYQLLLGVGFLCHLITHSFWLTL